MYRSPSIVKIVKSRDYNGLGMSRIGQTKNSYRFLVGKPLGKCSLGRLRRSCEDSIKMNLWEVDCEGGRWIWLWIMSSSRLFWYWQY
jgi:hypothetical protein